MNARLHARGPKKWLVININELVFFENRRVPCVHRVFVRELGV